jgi:hypothetical protein
MKEGEEIGNDVFNMVGYENLIAIELNLIAVNFNVVLDLWEIEQPCEVEGVINIEVDPEKRIVVHGIEVGVEFLVLIIVERRGRFCPKGLGFVDDVKFVGLYFLAFFPLRFLAKCYSDR